jgi:phenylalanyl-tRNA synthetase beta chain
VADVLVGAGFDEAYTLPLLAPADLERAAAGAAPVVEVENPLRAEESVLRPALLPGLLRAVAFNAAHGRPDVALFETGTVFSPPADGEPLPVERRCVAAARSGMVRRAPHEPDRPVTVHDLVAVVEALVHELRVARWRLDAAAVAGYQAGRVAHVVVDGTPIGAVGEVAPDVVARLELPSPVCALELDVDRLVTAARSTRAYVPVSRFPASRIDLAFVVADDVPAAAVRATLAEAGGTELERVELFDVFRSDAIGAGRVSLAFGLWFRAADRTLTDEEVAAARARCIAAVESAHAARLRG